MNDSAKTKGGSSKLLVVAVLIAAVISVVVFKSRNAQQAPGDTEASGNVTVSTDTPSDGNAGAEPTVSEKLPKMVDLGAGKCIPCKMMTPILDELEKEYRGRLKVEVIDVWENPEPGRRYGIRLIPTQIFFDPDGKELFRHEGFYSTGQKAPSFQARG